eukprot:3188947-Prymnesium_polylepis.3
MDDMATRMAAAAPATAPASNVLGLQPISAGTQHRAHHSGTMIAQLVPQGWAGLAPCPALMASIAWAHRALTA